LLESNDAAPARAIADSDSEGLRLLKNNGLYFFDYHSR
jgi:hypothetical protein